MAAMPSKATTAAFAISSSPYWDATPTTASCRKRDGKSVMSFVCKRAASDDLTTEFFKSMALPEIEDSTNFDVPEVYFNPMR